MSASVGQVTDTNPIVNDPFRQPSQFWHFSGDAPELREGRRPAGYLPPAPKHDGEVRITDEAIELKLINDLRDRVGRWRADGYPGATKVTRDLFDFWFDDERKQSTTRPFFAQQEAIETIAFLTEAPSDRRVGIKVPEPESFLRLGTKMATGTGKTLVMALIITWCGLNKASNRQDRRYSDAFLVVCPNLTVLMRLTGREGLIPSEPESAFEVYDLIPRNMSKLIGQVKVQVINWHKLAPFEDPEHGIVQRGPESDGAFARRVLDGTNRQEGTHRRLERRSASRMATSARSHLQGHRRGQEGGRDCDRVGRWAGEDPSSDRDPALPRPIRNTDVPESCWTEGLGSLRVGCLRLCSGGRNRVGASQDPSRPN